MHRLRTSGISVAIAACALTAPVTLAQPVKLGPEFQVNAYTTGGQFEAAVEEIGGGSFVVVWSSTGNQDGDSYGVFGRRFTSSGDAVGDEFQVNTYTSSVQRSPDVAAEAGGDFVVVWQSFAQDGHVFGIFGQRFSSGGERLGGEFRISTFTLDQQGDPSVAMDAAGNFVVSWSSGSQDGDFDGVFAQRFDDSGTPLSVEFQVNTQTPGFQRFSSAAMDTDGDFVIVWSDEVFPGEIFGRRFSSSGVANGAEFRVNSYTEGSQLLPSVAMDPSGGFVVVWQSYGQDGSDNGVFGRRFNSSGAGLSGDFPVNVHTPGSQVQPHVSRASNGDFVVAWSDPTLDGSTGAFGLAFNKFAGPQGEDQFQINSYTSGTQVVSDVAMTSAGGFVAVWLSLQDGDSAGVFAQRFSNPLAVTIDVDGNGVADPLTDGILLLRYLFGFRGDVLIAGAFDDEGCTRCDAPAIEAFIAPLVP